MTRTPRVAVYARHSTSFQNPESSDDQVRACNPMVEPLGGKVAAVFTDPEISGYRRDRPGLLSMLRRVEAGEFDIVACEALDRIARDGEDVAWLGKKLRFERVALHTITEGEICDMKLAVASMMGALFLTNLRRKTLRGMESAILGGRMAGGRVYGYRRSTTSMGPNGPIPGRIEIDPDTAPIVRRILTDFSKGRSAYKIASDLNHEGVAGPSGGKWNQSTIRGDPKKLVGILHNPLYRGTLIWGRREWRRNPDSFKRERRYRLRDRSEWTVNDVPDLRIINEALAAAVDGEVARRRSPGRSGNAKGGSRGKHLLSGLIKCGSCGSNYVINGKDYYRCAGNREGRCDNRPSIRKSVIEDAALSVLQERLLTLEMAELFASEFAREVDRLRDAGSADAQRLKERVVVLEAEIDNLAQNFAKGVVSDTLAGMLTEREMERRTLLDRINLSEVAKFADVLPHPVLLERYTERIAKAREALSDPNSRVEAAQTLRSLLTSVTIHPSDGGAIAEVVGDPGKIIDFSQNSETASGTNSPGSSIAVVAGVGFEPTTFRL